MKLVGFKAGVVARERIYVVITAWGKFGCAPGWSAGDDMYEHVSTGGGVLARVITYARSRYCLG